MAARSCRVKSGRPASPVPAGRLWADPWPLLAFLRSTSFGLLDRFGAACLRSHPALSKGRRLRAGLTFARGSFGRVAWNGPPFPFALPS